VLTEQRRGGFPPAYPVHSSLYLLFHVGSRREGGSQSGGKNIPQIVFSGPIAPQSLRLFSILAVFVMIRFGLLALVANHVVFSILQHFPLTTEFSAWYAGIGLTGILLIVSLAFYGFYVSLGGRPVFGGAILEE